MYRQARTALFVVCTAIAWTSSAAADVVSDWNVCALESLEGDGLGFNSGSVLEPRSI